jgi:hypothetical protein
MVKSMRLRCTRADEMGNFAVMTVPDGDSPVEQALTGGTPLSTSISGDAGRRSANETDFVLPSSSYYVAGKLLSVTPRGYMVVNTS